MDAREAALVVAKCRGELFTDASEVKSPRGWKSVPLCAIDSVFSIGVKYAGVTNLVRRYEAYWKANDVDANSISHTTRDFLDEFGGRQDLAVSLFGNRQLTSSRGGIPKADAVVQLIGLLGSADFDIQTTAELRDHFGDQKLDAAIRNIHGQGSGLSAKYLFVLAGVEDAVKPDRMIIRFVSSAVGRRVKPIEAQDLVKAASAELRKADPRLTPRTLDHLIWEHQRTR